ncbi:hypothetical protein CDD83_4238 [Cordyceps sp. RAO-2017]|nr:hypothetical protein CDD83_4238 [Cordyceps sp. RAO-2017]
MAGARGGYEAAAKREAPMWGSAPQPGVAIASPVGLADLTLPPSRRTLVLSLAYVLRSRAGAVSRPRSTRPGAVFRPQPAPLTSFLSLSLSLSLINLPRIFPCRRSPRLTSTSLGSCGITKKEASVIIVTGFSTSSAAAYRVAALQPPPSPQAVAQPQNPLDSLAHDEGRSARLFLPAPFAVPFHPTYKNTPRSSYKAHLIPPLSPCQPPAISTRQSSRHSSPAPDRAVNLSAHADSLLQSRTTTFVCVPDLSARTLQSLLLASPPTAFVLVAQTSPRNAAVDHLDPEQCVCTSSLPTARAAGRISSGRPAAHCHRRRKAQTG